MTNDDFGLRLARVRIQDFKALRHVSMILDKKTTVLVGENNSGKTSFLEALDVAFGRRQARVQDLFKDLDSRAEKFEIDLMIEPADGDDFPDDVLDLFGTAIQFSDAGPNFAAIRVSGDVSAEGWDMNVTRHFLKGWADSRAEAAQLEVLSSPRLGRAVLNLLHFDLLDARRDIVEQLRNRRTHWGRATSQIDVPEEVRTVLETQLRELGRELTEKSPILTGLKGTLSELSGGLSATGMNVELEALPRSVDDLIKAMDIMITSPESNTFSIEEHGMGTRSLGALLVFRGFVNDVRARHSSGNIMSVSAFEEPEAHLHPHAQRAAFNLLGSLKGQTIISTHSPQISAITSLAGYRLFRRKGPETVVSVLSEEITRGWDRDKVRQIVQLEHPEVLFSRGVGVVEGQTEGAVFPILARHRWPGGADAMGLSLVCTRGAGNSRHIVPFLEALDIPWQMFCDGDPAGHEGVTAVKNVIARDFSAQVLQIPNNESFEGYIMSLGEEYHNAVKRAIDTHPGSSLDHYIKKNHGNKIKGGGGKRDYESEGGEERAILDFMLRNKGTFGRYLAEELVKADLIPPLVVEFFDRLEGK